VSRTPRFWLPVFIAVIFTIGVATGSLLRDYVQPTPAAREAVAPQELSLNRGPGSLFITVLVRELRLSPEQQVQIEAILQSHRRQVMADREEVRRQFDGQTQAALEKIRQALTPDQQERLDVLASRFRERRFGDGPGTSPRP